LFYLAGMESYDLHKLSIMTQCIDGVKHLCTSVLGCFDLDLFKQSGGGLGDPELLSRDTVCMPISFSILSFYVVRFI